MKEKNRGLLCSEVRFMENLGLSQSQGVALSHRTFRKPKQPLCETDSSSFIGVTDVWFTTTLLSVFHVTNCVCVPGKNVSGFCFNLIWIRTLSKLPWSRYEGQLIEPYSYGIAAGQASAPGWGRWCLSLEPCLCSRRDGFRARRMEWVADCSMKLRISVLCRDAKILHWGSGTGRLPRERGLA